MMMESVKDDDGTFRLPHSHSHILTLTLTHSGQGQASSHRTREKPRHISFIHFYPSLIIISQIFPP